MVSHADHAATATMMRIQIASTNRDGSFDVFCAGAKVGKRTGQRLMLLSALSMGAKPKRSQCVRLIRFKTHDDSMSWLTDNSTRNLAAQATMGRNSSWSYKRMTI